MGGVSAFIVIAAILGSCDEIFEIESQPEEKASGLETQGQI
jgi:hypothetical protein|tara:strand:+ start:8312 stop:8434 length:123 start_codon:yes stop_codon:yes gene_type:complete